MAPYIQKARESVAAYETGLAPSSELAHLLAIMVGPRASQMVCGELATQGVCELAQMTSAEFMNQGLSQKEAQRLYAAFEMAKRWIQSTQPKTKCIHSPEDAAHLVMDDMRFLMQEHFASVYLNTKNKIIHQETNFIGSLNASIVHPRECFKAAVKYSAASIVCVHNHPSGDPSPSREDLEITKRLVECGKMIGIEVLDHIVIGNQKFISLKEKGYV